MAYFDIQTVKFQRCVYLIYLLKLSTDLLLMYKRLKIKIIQVTLFLFTNFIAICVGIPYNNCSRYCEADWLSGEYTKSLIKHLFTIKANDYFCDFIVEIS